MYERLIMKILAIASVGGHWIQLLRLRPAFKGHDIVYVSTHQEYSTMVEGHQFYAVPDSNRWQKTKLLKTFSVLMKIIFKERPNVIISTGAAPGLIALCIGKLIGARTIWVDSIANAEKLSLSGKFAIKIASRVYTQWPELSNDKLIFKGSVIR